MNRKGFPGLPVEVMVERGSGGFGGVVYVVSRHRSYDRACQVCGATVTVYLLSMSFSLCTVYFSTKRNKASDEGHRLVTVECEPRG